MRRRHFLKGLVLGLAAADASARPAEEADTQVDRLDRKAARQALRATRLRVRVTSLSPPEVVELRSRSGGEGVGGEARRSVHLTEDGRTPALGDWSAWVDTGAVALVADDHVYVTFTAGRPERPPNRRGKPAPPPSMGAEFEVELESGGRTQKVSVRGPLGATGTVGLRAVPAGVQLLDLQELARLRLAAAGPAEAPPLRELSVVTDVVGFGRGFGYGIRSTDPALASQELEVVRRLAANGLRNRPELGAAATSPPIDAFSRARVLGTLGWPLEKPAGRRGPDRRCPSSPAAKEDATRRAEEFLRLAAAEAAPEVWVLTVDEIGSVFMQTPEKRQHPVVCPACIAAFRDYARARGATPATLGARDWEGVVPLDLFADGPYPDWDRSPALGRLAGLTAEFAGYATARVFEPIRTAFTAQRAAADATNAKVPRVYSYALRGNTFLREAHTLDFFDFYDHADDAAVYETSNREARVHQWDAYLCDVLRATAARRSMKIGVYVKPHRGAPVQRALAAVTRGASLLHWYTYGPDYGKGDAFSERAEVVTETRRAADLLRAAEPWVFGASPAVPARVAILKSETTQRWARMTTERAAAVLTSEDAKWGYSALRQAGVVLDAVDESHAERGELDRYSVVHAYGLHLRGRALEGLLAWTERGGTLVVTAGSLRRDESGVRRRDIDARLGLAERAALEVFVELPVTSAVPFPDLAVELREPPRPPGELHDRGAPKLPLRVAREPLRPLPGTEVLATFADGAAAITRRALGRGQVLVLGLLPGCEASVPLRRADWDL
ncbi:MAG: hypothetical protein FJ104_04145, partial [Deltaproteobacteria bacterium]|nr:hypothetical protein [Deltaproteobacteria bacterium]